MKMRSGRRMLRAGRSAWSEVGSAWCHEPAQQQDRGAPRHHRLSLPSGKHAHQTHGRWAPATRPYLPKEAMMEVVYPRCCGLDLHKRLVVACLIVPGPDGTLHKEMRTFGTMTDDLLGLADWLAAHAVTHVAMESTGVYW